jgi:hypothetical protein
VSIGGALGRGAERVIDGLHRRPRLLAGLVLAAVLLVVMSRLLPGRGLLLADDIWTSDLLNNNVPPRAFLGRALREGHFPLWVPGIYGGLPLIPQGEAAAANPLTWLLFGLFDWITATNLTVAVHSWVAGFGTLLLARSLRAGWAGALAAGIAYMLCGFLVEHLKHLNLHHAAAWLPWMVYATDRLRAEPGWRSALSLGAIAGLQITEGHPQVSYIALFLLLPFLAFRIVEASPPGSLRLARTWARLVGFGLLSLLVAGLLAGAYLVAGLELLAQSERMAETTNSWEFATYFEFVWQNLYTLIWAHAFGDGANATYDPRYGIFWESWLYVGIVPAGAAALAVLASLVRLFRRDTQLLSRSFFLLLLAAIAFALTLGKHSVVYAWAFHVLPGMTWFRFHHRFAVILELCVILLGALGIDVVVRRVGRSIGPRAAALVGAIVVFGAAADMVHIMRRHFPAIPRAVAERPPPTLAVLEANAPDEPWRVHTVFAPEVHVEAFDRARGWSRTWRPFVEQWALLQPSLHLVWGLDSAVGYTSVVPFDVATVLGTHTVGGMLVGARTHSAKPPKECEQRGRRRYTGPCRAELECTPTMSLAFGAFNVRFLLSPAPLRRCRGWRLLETVASGPWEIGVYENANVLPRAYLAREIVDVPTVREAATRLVDGRFRPGRQVLRVADASAAPAGAQPAEPGAAADPSANLDRRSDARRGSGWEPCDFEALAPGHSRVRCDVDGPSVLVVAETRYRGQQVRLDGEPVESFAANGIQVGLELPPGTHEIEVEYRPGYRWLLRAAMAGWAALLALGLWNVSRRWRREKHVSA